MAIAASPGRQRLRGGELERLDAALDGLRVDGEDGEVARGVLADELGRDRVALLAEADGELVGVLDDVVVGDDVARRVDDEAGAGRGLAAALPVEGERAVAAAGGDEDHAAGDLLVDVGDARRRGRRARPGCWWTAVRRPSSWW